MNTLARLLRSGALSLLVVILAGVRAFAAQAPTEPVPAPAPKQAEELSQAELLKSYLQMREQLQATQIAIVNNRVAGVTEKIDAIKAAMDSERERQQAETARLAAERERQQAEAQRTNRLVLWVAGGFAAIGLIAMFVMPLLQWRVITRMSEASAPRSPALPAAPPAPALMPGEAAGPSDQTVAVSNQRLMTVIDRIERRIYELEHTTAHPLPVASVTTVNGTDTTRRNSTAANDQAAWVAVLMGKARSLLNGNKANDAITCYDEVLRLDAMNTDALVRKGTALERLNRFEEALQCYERALTIDGKMTLAHISKGSVCNRLGRYDEALQCYEQALAAADKSKVPVS